MRLIQITIAAGSRSWRSSQSLILGIPDSVNILFLHKNNRDVRLREISVILRVLLAPHGIALPLIVVPAARLLCYTFTAKEQVGPVER